MTVTPEKEYASRISTTFFTPEFLQKCKDVGKGGKVDVFIKV